MEALLILVPGTVGNAGLPKFRPLHQGSNREVMRYRNLVHTLLQHNRQATILNLASSSTRILSRANISQLINSLLASALALANLLPFRLNKL